MTGMLYSLIALGFVLIFKASGVFNFAQGAMVLFAALAMARFAEWIPHWLGFDNKLLANVLAFAVALVMMIVVAWLIERLVLRQLVNQEGITLLMATLGMAYFLDGVGQTLFGSDIYKIDVGMPKDPIFLFENIFQGGILINKEDLFAAVIAAALVALLSLFFQKTSTGRALRAVADDHQAAQSIGIPLNRIWVIVWCVAGIVALVAGIIWGCKLGVQFSLALVALKALPVVILGGLTCVPGAIIGGLIIGVGEKLSEVYLGPMSAAASRSGSPTCWRCSFFCSGRKACSARRSLIGSERCCTEKTVSSRPATGPTSRSSRSRRTASAIALLVAFAFVGVPLLADEYMFRAILIPFLILSLAALGLNILVGYCGQISLGTGAFMAVGAYAAYNFLIRDRWHAAARVDAAGRRVRHRGRRGLRHPIPAHQGAVSGRGDAGGAVLLRLGLPAHQVVHQRLGLGFGVGVRPQRLGWPSTRRWRSTCSAWASWSCLRCWPRTWCAATSGANGWRSATWTWRPR